VGAKDVLPGPLAALGRGVAGAIDRLPVPLPAPAPDLPLQFIHEDDVGQAFALCIAGAGPPGIYNIAGDGVVSAREVARELGLTPVPVPAGLVKGGARVLAAATDLPFVPAATEWVEAVTHPSIMDAGKARRELGWSPRYTGIEALRETLGR
jgi:nucleoside-diphosphate-sugar epimerase